MERSAGQGKSPSRRMANRARSPLTERTRKGRSSRARPFTTRRRTGAGGHKFATANLSLGESEVSDRRQSGDCRSRLFSAGDLLHERVETRIAAQIVEHWIYLDSKKVVGLTLCVGTLQLLDGTIFVTQSYLNQR